MLFLLSFLSLSVAGQVIGDFTLTDIRNGNEVSLNDYSTNRAVVVIFTSQNCPYDNYYLDRLKQLSTDFEDRNVGILYVNSIPSESAEELKSSVAEWPAPYLSDKQQVVMKLLGVSKTPESIILIPVNGGFRKIYQGAIDNNPQVATDVKKAYLRENLVNVLEGQPLTYANVLPVGCRIRTP